MTGGGSSISPRTTGTSGTQATGTRPTSAGRSGQSSSIPENTAVNESAQGVSERQTLADGTTAPATGHTGSTTTGTETSTGAGTGTGFGTGTGSFLCCRCYPQSAAPSSTICAGCQARLRCRAFITPQRASNRAAGRSTAPAVTHTDSISQRYTPTELPSLDPRRDQMTKLVGSTTGLPPGPGGQIEELTASYDKKVCWLPVLLLGHCCRLQSETWQLAVGPRLGRSAGLLTVCTFSHQRQLLCQRACPREKDRTTASQCTDNTSQLGVLDNTLGPAKAQSGIKAQADTPCVWCSPGRLPRKRHAWPSRRPHPPAWQLRAQTGASGRPSWLRRRWPMPVPGMPRCARPTLPG